MDAPGTAVGDGITATANEILRVEVGSTAHGISVGNDDLDLMEVYLETPEQLLGIAEHAEHFVCRTQPEGARSGPGDVDYVAYSLRKFLRLATSGNPTVLVVLYGSTVHATSPLGDELRALAPAIVSRRAGYRFLGYLEGQLERMRGGGRQSRVPSRPELVERHGYDTKYAAHALRLGLQGIELIDTGRLTLPLPAADRDLCLKVRSGEYPRDEVDTLVEGVRVDLAHAVNDASRGSLRAEPDMNAVNAFAVRAHQEHWRRAAASSVLSGS